MRASLAANRPASERSGRSRSLSSEQAHRSAGVREHGALEPREVDDVDADARDAHEHIVARGSITRP